MKDYEDEYEDDYEGIILPVFSFPTNVTYYCGNGFTTSDLEEAKAHGYGKGRRILQGLG